MANNRLSQTEVINISKFLESVIEHTPHGVKYKGPWTDQKVATKFGVTLNNVYYLRAKVFGPIYREPEPVAKPRHTILNTVAEMRTLMLAHTEMIDRLTARISYLERELGVTRTDIK